MNTMKEGQVRIPSGCAISGIFAKDGKLISGRDIITSISTMHDRSNGLGGGFAGYGIYPQYKDLYALHVFYDSLESRNKCEAYLDDHFDIVNLSKIPRAQISEDHGRAAYLALLCPSASYEDALLPPRRGRICVTLYFLH